MRQKKLPKKNKVVIGRFGSAHGIKGWVRVISFTDPITQILQYLPWQISYQGQWRLVEVAEQRKQGKHVVVRLTDCTSREDAQLLTHSEIAIEREQLPGLSEEEYYWVDLIGLKVVNTKGEELGHIDHLIRTGANDVLIVKNDRERLIPYIDTVIIKVDFQNKEMIVDWDSNF